FLLRCAIRPRRIHSFPTRRSSDLREYVVEDAADGRVLRAVADSGLGIMHPDNRAAPVQPLSELAGGGKEVTADDPVIITKTNALDRKSTRLNSSHVSISYAGFCLQ